MKIKKKWRRKFWHNIKFKYKLSIINENTLEEIVGLHVSKLNGFSVLLSACIFIFIIAAVLIALTPLRNYLPGYMNSEVRQQVVTNALRADSLEEALFRQKLYVKNIQAILSGQVKADSVKSIDSLTGRQTPPLLERSEAEEKFRRRYEEKERYNLTAVADARQAVSLVFYRPVQGMLERPFDPSAHNWGIDISVSPGQNISAVLDGTVVMATYTPESGYVIQVQHAQNFLSVYSHCGSLLKQAGDHVKGGEIIARTAEKGENGKQTFRFELWHRGSAVNPVNYVAF